jgi:IclR family transcriptional regulator, KDG regulon repressor
VIRQAQSGVCYNRHVTLENIDKLTGSIAHATSVLVCIGNDVHALTDIARECNLGKSTVHRVLKLLEQSRLVVQDTINRRYYLGPLLTRLTSNPITTHEYLIMYASDEMKRLCQVSEETITLDIMIGVQAFSLHEVASQQNLKVTQENEITGPLRAGASIKVLLSMLNDKQLKAAIDSFTITRQTEHTVTDKEVLMAQIKDTRQQGYAISRGEWVDGVICISVPVFNYSLPLSLSVVGPESRVKEREKTVIKELKASAARIAENIKRLSEHK